MRCTQAEPIITDQQQLAWMKEYLPEHYRVMVKAIGAGDAIVAQAKPGSKHGMI